MLNKLKDRWKVNTVNLFLVILTFALGGSLCGYLGRKVLTATEMDKGALWVITYVVLITLLWPICVLAISIPFGQFAFFKKYLSKIWARMTGKKKKTISIAIFASGAGSNAQKIITHFKGDEAVTVALVICNKPGAGVLNIAAAENIPTLLIEKEQFFRGDHYLPELKQYGIEFIVLAGFLWKIPGGLISAYPNKIVNIHPALLPKYGGKGMYGQFVHQAVIDAGDKESGISIHFVDELYDHGNIIFQARCPVMETDTPESLAAKIHALEHTHFPVVVSQVLKNENQR